MKYLIFIFISVQCLGQQFNSAQINSIQISPTYNSEYEAYLDRLTTLGYTLPSVGQRLKQNQLCSCLKNNIGPLKTYFDLLYIFANDGSKEAATVNLIYPNSFQMSIVNSLNWTSNLGFRGDAISMYGDTNFAYGTNGVVYTQNSAHRASYPYVGSAGSNLTIDGTSSGNDNASTNGLSLAQKINQSSNTPANLGLGSIGAVVGIDRIDASNLESFSFPLNRKYTTSTASTTTSNTLNQYVFRRGSNYGDVGLSFYSMGAHLTDGQWSNLNACVKAYISSL